MRIRSALNKNQGTTSEGSVQKPQSMKKQLKLSKPPEAQVNSG